MKSFFTTIVFIFSLIIIPGQSLASGNPRSFYQIVIEPTTNSASFTINYSGPQATDSNIVVSCSTTYEKREVYKATPGTSVQRNFTGLPSGDDCMISVYTADPALYDANKYLQQIDFNTLLNAGGDTQGGAGTLGSGTGPGTNPINSGTTPPNVIAPTPQASSAALLSCSKISFTSLLDILIWLKCIIGVAIIPLIFTLAFLFFLWGMAMYIRGSDDVKKREESKKFIYWGIIGLTVMVSVWGIVKIVNTTFGFGNTVPKLQTDYLKVPPKP